MSSHYYIGGLPAVKSLTATPRDSIISLRRNSNDIASLRRTVYNIPK